MHLNKGYLGEKHCFVTKMSHHSLHLPCDMIQKISFSCKFKLWCNHFQQITICSDFFQFKMNELFKMVLSHCYLAPNHPF
jgi:hypothetical protein